MDCKSSRRSFLSQTLTGISAAWISANMPAMLSAAAHARASQSAAPGKLEFFSADQAAEVVSSPRPTLRERAKPASYFLSTARSSPSQKTIKNRTPKACPRCKPESSSYFPRQLNFLPPHPSSKIKFSNRWTRKPAQMEGGPSVPAPERNPFSRRFACTPSWGF